jgi:branched-chain amino acid transport system substrate-binding protein
LNAYRYLVNEFNATQSDFSIQLIVEDGKCEGKSATSAVQKLIDVDQVQVIVGGICSSETMAAGRIAQQYGIPMISSISSSPEVSHIGDYIFRFFNDNDVSKVLAQYLTTQYVEKVVLVAEQSDVGLGFMNAFIENYSGETLSFTFNSQEKDFNLLAKQIKSQLTPSDFLITLPSNDTTHIALLKALAQEGILEMLKGRIAGNDTIANASVYEALGTQLDEIKTVQLKDVAYFPES